MEICQTARGVELVGIKDFDLAQTLDCGQSFRWQQHKDGSFSGIAFERPLRILWEGENLLLCDSNEEEFDSIWRAYFDLDFDYGALKLELAGISPAMKEAVRYAPACACCGRNPGKRCAPLFFRRTTTSRASRGLSFACARLSAGRCPEVGMLFQLRRPLQICAWKIWRRYARGSAPNIYWTRRKRWQAAKSTLLIPLLCPWTKPGLNCKKYGESAPRWRTASCCMGCTAWKPFQWTCG